MTFLLAAFRFLGLPIVIIVAFLGYFYGIPFLNDIPYINRIPVVRALILGKIEMERMDAAEEARLGYVLLAEKTQAEARADKLAKDLTAIEENLATYRKEMVRIYSEQSAEDVMNEKERADYAQRQKAAGTERTLNDDDIKWLCRRPGTC